MVSILTRKNLIRITHRPIIASSGNLPTVSIGLPTYNGEKRIVSTLVSILNQGYPHLEIIISDNCSADLTEILCKDLSAKYASIHYYRQKNNIGIISNYEFVLSKASGDLFMWIADDDLLEPGILQKYVDFLITHSDYSLVSGQIQYWTGNERVFIERDFSMEKNNRRERVIKYYGKVVHGAVYYGLMPRKIALQLSLQNRMGEDWHFVAKVAYLGKIKMLDCIGYHKKLNGSSKTLRQYARMIGASWFSAGFPHAQIALDAYSEIMTSAVYQDQKNLAKLILAIHASMHILINHWKRYPSILAGKFMRLLGFKKRQSITPQNTLKEKWAWGKGKMDYGIF